MSQHQVEIPRWIDLVVLPLFNLMLAFGASAIVLLAIDQSPLQVLALLVKGSFGSAAGISYTLYYATTFVFTGLAVAVAYHAGLFNIGGEGQAYLSGLGATLVILAFDQFLPGIILLPLALIAATFCTKPGRWFMLQVGVKAPGTAKRTTLRPAKMVSVESFC